MRIHDERCFVVHAQHLTLVPMVVVLLLKSKWPPILPGHNFLAPRPGLPLAPFLFLWYSDDISDSLLESKSKVNKGEINQGETSKSGCSQMKMVDRIFILQTSPGWKGEGGGLHSLKAKQGAELVRCRDS